MSLDTIGQKRAATSVRTDPNATAPAPRKRRSRRLFIALTFAIMAGFLLGLYVPIHP